MDFAFRSEKGAPNSNEDACLALPERGLFMVCDGLGPKGNGDVAARVALEAMSHWLEKSQSQLLKYLTFDKESKRHIENIFQAGFQEASKQIFHVAQSSEITRGICTTIDLVYFLGTHAIIGHVGSGRIYLLRNEELHLVTEDHTHLAHMRRAGKLEGISETQQQSLAKCLSRAVGFQEDVKADILEIELEPGDRFFMVTDGVWMPLAEDSLETIFSSDKKSSAVLDLLHKSVIALSPRDNFTTVVVEAPIKKVEDNFASADQKVKMLGNVPAFQYLSYQDLIKVINAGDLFKIATGKYICKEGDPGGEMMLILSGSVEIRKNEHKIRVLKKGDVFGELSMVDEAPRSASVLTLESTNLLAFPRAALFELFREIPELAVKFLWGVTMETNKRLRAASNKMVGRPENEGLETNTHGPLPFFRSK